MDILKLANEIIDGRRLGRDEDLSFLTECDLDELTEGAGRICKAFCGDKVDLCTIINGRSGKCSEDCKYCAQSSHHNTNCEVYDFLDEDTILAEARANEKEGVDSFSIVTSGRTLSPTDFEKALSAYRKLSSKCDLLLCGSHGFLTLSQFRALREAGVTRYHSNIETSRRYFPYICSTHTFDEKIENIKRARQGGMTYVCSGGIIGMGETWEDRIDMALTLSELHVDSIPINALMPIPGTPLEGMNSLSKEDILRTVAIFRYINPDTDIRLAAGRKLLGDGGERAFRSGASATITGNMLTTSGLTIAQDREMLKSIGKEIVRYEK